MTTALVQQAYLQQLSGEAWAEQGPELVHAPRHTMLNARPVGRQLVQQMQQRAANEIKLSASVNAGSEQQLVRIFWAF